MLARSQRYLSDNESYYLRFSLLLKHSNRTIKKTLQHLCTLYEGGRRLRDPTEHRQLIHGHLWSEDVLLRRWSLKALGLIANPDDWRRIIERLKVEDDVEAQTWGAAALLSNARDRPLSEVCREAGLESSTPLWLAARLYAPKLWIGQHWQPVRVSLHDEDLTLKWAIFLAGYGKAPIDLFDPKHDNNIFLGELNSHSCPEIVEYSVWALHEREDYGFTDLRILPHEFLSKPENARKWLYRLLLQSPDDSAVDHHQVLELRRADTSVSAREGLALGLLDCPSPALDPAILDWYDTERDPLIREILISAMAARSERSADFADTVERAFNAEQPDSRIRVRLLAASEGTRLYHSLKGASLRDEWSRQGLLGFQMPQMVLVQGDVNVATFNASRDINAQNLAGGNMIADIIKAVQNIPQDRESDKKILEMVLAFAKSQSLDEGQRSAINASVSAVATNPNSETRKGVLSVLQGVAGAVGTVAGLTEIIDAVSGWLG